MTNIDTEKLARGWGLIAEGAMEISLAYSAIESGAVRDTAPTTGAGGVPPQPPVPAASFDELPPEEYDDPPRLKPNVDAGLGKCPVHGVAWSIRPAGVGAKGPYQAFYKCAERDESKPKGYCTEKPQKIWRDTHPIREVA